MKPLPSLIANLVLLSLLVSCSRSRATDLQAEPLMVAAASSVEGAMTEIGALYEQETGKQVDFVFGSSGNLATQIQNGAPFDLFVSADDTHIRRLETTASIRPDSIKHYANGQLILVYNIASGVSGDSLSAISQPEVLHVAIANPEIAPYGFAAKQALTNSELWDEVESRIVYGTNVRHALQFVQTGDAQVGLVARSIADVPEVSFVEIDSSLYDPLIHSLAIVSTSSQPKDAVSFADFISGEQGRQTLTKYGFTLPDKDSP